MGEFISGLRCHESRAKPADSANVCHPSFLGRVLCARLLVRASGERGSSLTFGKKAHHATLSLLLISNWRRRFGILAHTKRQKTRGRMAVSDVRPRASQRRTRILRYASRGSLCRSTLQDRKSDVGFYAKSYPGDSRAGFSFLVGRSEELEAMRSKMTEDPNLP